MVAKYFLVGSDQGPPAVTWNAGKHTRRKHSWLKKHKHGLQDHCNNRGKMRVALYARVSTDDQNVDQQMVFLKEWFTRQDNTIVLVIKDTESGTRPLVDRRRFLRLLEKSKQGLFDAIGVVNLDRLTRNWEDVVFIEKHFRENWEKCKLISTGDTIDLSNASGRFQFRVKMAMNCYMPEDMREKQKVGIARAKKQGKYLGGKPGRSWSNRAPSKS
jgi:DNA invertase Pin-like site-specific DNA recombinase